MRVWDDILSPLDREVIRRGGYGKPRGLGSHPTILVFHAQFNKMEKILWGVSEMKVVVVEGGWSGCAAALSASKQGAEVTLLEQTDMLLGTGLVGGIVQNNGRQVEG